jgi:hypothetical protein
MKTTLNKLALAAALTIVAVPALAAGEGAGNEIGWIGYLFLGFGALIIVMQLVPAVVLFGSMLKGLFTTAKPTLATGEGEKKS